MCWASFDRPSRSMRLADGYPRCAKSVPRRATTSVKAGDTATHLGNIWDLQPGHIGFNATERDEAYAFGQLYTPAVGGSIPSAPTKVWRGRGLLAAIWPHV
jgi:hypothetical protein